MSNTPRVPIVPTGVEGQTRLSDEAELTGRVTGGDFAVQGHVDGDIVLTGWLRVGRSGRVKGNVQAAAAEIGGGFDGELSARVLVFTETAHARGRFLSERLVIREGAHVDGAFDALPTQVASAPAAKGAAPAQKDEPAAAADTEGKSKDETTGDESRPQDDESAQDEPEDDDERAAGAEDESTDDAQGDEPRTQE